MHDYTNSSHVDCSAIWTYNVIEDINFQNNLGCVISIKLEVLHGFMYYYNVSMLIMSANS